MDLVWEICCWRDKPEPVQGHCLGILSAVALSVLNISRNFFAAWAESGCMSIQSGCADQAQASIGVFMQWRFSWPAVHLQITISCMGGMQKMPSVCCWTDMDDHRVFAHRHLSCNDSPTAATWQH